MAYATSADLSARIGPEAMLAIFDDDNDGVADAGPLNAILAQASGRVDSYIARAYKGPFPIPVDPVTGAIPAMVVSATVEWARAFAFQRRPEYVRDFKDAPTKEAIAVSESLANGVEYLTDNSAQNVPGVAGGITTAPGPRIFGQGWTFPGITSSDSGDF